MAAHQSDPIVDEDLFDRAKILAALFSLPVPPIAKGGKRYPINTPLGRIMRIKGFSVRQTSEGKDCPHERTLSDYLAGRSRMPMQHRRALAEHLGVDARVL